MSAVVVAACGSTLHGDVSADVALPGEQATSGVFSPDNELGTADRLPTSGELGTPGKPDPPGVATEGPVSAPPEAQPDAPSDGGVDAVPEPAPTTDPATEPEGEESTPPPGPGSTEPFQVGVLITETDTFQESAGFEGYTAFHRDTLLALVRAINDAGGVAGRKLEVVEAAMDYMATSYDNQFEAACQKFTVDHDVGAVIYDGITYNQNFNACLTQAGVPVFYMGSSGSVVGDSTDFENYPGLIAPNSVTIDRRIQSILNKAVTAGFLESGSRLGVLVESCPYNLRVYDRTLTPLVNQYDVAVSRQDLGCGHGSADHGSGIGGTESAVLRFRSDNVDTVMFLSTAENGLVYYFAQSAESQGWAPQYLLFHNQGHPEAMAAYPRNQLVKMRGFGGLPLIDVTSPPAPPPPQAEVRRTCLGTLESQGVGVNGVQEVIAFDACDAVSLLHQALTLSGGQGGIEHLVPAVERIGTDFVSASDLNGVTRFGPGRHDGMELTAVSAFHEDCECMAYVSEPSPIQ